MGVSKVFGENLRHLCGRARSQAAVARAVGISQVQLSRFIAGQSYPKPRVLHDICRYFDVDARIMLEPLDTLTAPGTRGVELPFPATPDISDNLQPNGFYRAYRVSSRFPGQALRELRYVYRDNGRVMLRRYYPKSVQTALTAYENEEPNRYESQIFMAGRGMFTLSTAPSVNSVFFEFWNPVINMNRQIWTGYSVYALEEALGASRAARSVVEQVDAPFRDVLGLARTLGYVSLKEVEPHIPQLLRADVPFA